MSTHEILVVSVEEIFPHPNADKLEIIKVSGNDYSIVAKKDDFKIGDLAIYIEPDYEVPLDRPEFSFLKRSRIATMRLRGVWSEGLLIHALPHHKLDDNVITELGITRWEPAAPKKGSWWGAKGSALRVGWCTKAPKLEDTIVYDLENIRQGKYKKLITQDDKVFLTTKLHGAGCRCVFTNNEMFCGSRTTWKKKPGTLVDFKNKRTGEIYQKSAPTNTWWEALEQNSWIESWCRKNPDCIVYGEIFGTIVQGYKFHYGYQAPNIGLRVFDIFENGRWIDFDELVNNKRFSELKLVPILYHGFFNKEIMETLAEEKETSLENCGENHIREGIVVKLEKERYDENLGRIALKYVSKIYLSKGEVEQVQINNTEDSENSEDLENVED